jgi:hypothetical protein
MNSICKVKVKLSLCLTKHHVIKTYWRSGGIAPRILYLGSRRRWVVSFTTRPLCPQGKSPWYPLDRRRLGGPQSRSGRGGEEKNSQPLPGLEPPDHPARSQALYYWSIPTTVCWVVFWNRSGLPPPANVHEIVIIHYYNTAITSVSLIAETMSWNYTNWFNICLSYCLHQT